MGSKTNIRIREGPSVLIPYSKVLGALCQEPKGDTHTHTHTHTHIHFPIISQRYMIYFLQVLSILPTVYMLSDYDPQRLSKLLEVS